MGPVYQNPKNEAALAFQCPGRFTVAINVWTIWQQKNEAVRLAQGLLAGNLLGWFQMSFWRFGAGFHCARDSFSPVGIHRLMSCFPTTFAVGDTTWAYVFSCRVPNGMTWPEKPWSYSAFVWNHAGTVLYPEKKIVEGIIRPSFLATPWPCPKHCRYC